jgi:hypothetical protein
MRVLANAVPDTETVAVLHTSEGPPAVGAITDGAVYLVGASTIKGDDEGDNRPFGTVRRVAIDPRKAYMEVAVRLHFSQGEVWREAHWGFFMPGTELRFRTYQHLGGEAHKIPEDFALALARRLDFEFPEDVEPQRLADMGY